jgi:hypothetical protein
MAPQQAEGSRCTQTTLPGEGLNIWKPDFQHPGARNLNT